MNSPLKWDVFVNSQIPAFTTDLPPGGTEMKWSPITQRTKCCRLVWRLDHGRLASIVLG
jgi:hypothetical protein